MRVLVAFVLLVSCSKEPAPAEPPCNVLFGRPNDMTGLTSEQCQPRCTCGGDAFVANEYTASDVDELKTVAGRTRRNTGLPNAMCRPCEEVRPLVHSYR